MSEHTTEVTCTLGVQDAEERLDEWSEMRAQAHSVTVVDGVTTMMFPTDLEEEVRDLATRENSCCAFLRLTVEADGAGCRLEIRSSEPNGVGMVAMLGGADPRGPD